MLIRSIIFCIAAILATHPIQGASNGADSSSCFRGFTPARFDSEMFRKIKSAVGLSGIPDDKFTLVVLEHIPWTPQNKMGQIRVLISEGEDAYIVRVKVGAFRGVLRNGISVESALSGSPAADTFARFTDQSPVKAHIRNAILKHLKIESSGTVSAFVHTISQNLSETIVFAAPVIESGAALHGEIVRVSHDKTSDVTSTLTLSTISENEASDAVKRLSVKDPIDLFKDKIIAKIIDGNQTFTRGDFTTFLVLAAEPEATTFYAYTKKQTGFIVKVSHSTLRGNENLTVSRTVTGQRAVDGYQRMSGDDPDRDLRHAIRLLPGTTFRYKNIHFLSRTNGQTQFFAWDKDAQSYYVFSVNHDELRDPWHPEVWIIHEGSRGRIINNRLSLPLPPIGVVAVPDGT